MKKNIIMIISVVLPAVLMLTGCASEAQDVTADKTNQEEASEEKETTEVTILAAASLTDVCTELEGIYEKENPGTDLIFSFGSSGALQTQIEEGVDADIFFSAALKQMEALKDEGLMEDDTIKELLENKIVLVVPKGSDKDITKFEDAADDKAEMIGLGDPESVPAGQYAEEVFTSLGILDQVKEKANYGTDVRMVLNWVSSGEVDCGVVYATDAYTEDGVEIVCEAPEGSCKKVIYPVGITKASKKKEAAGDFLDFLSSEETLKIFEKYGFAGN